MGVVDPLKGPSYDLMTCSENFRFNPNSVNIPHTKIILYLPLTGSSVLQFHITKCFALSAGKVDYTLTLY